MDRDLKDAFERVVKVQDDIMSKEKDELESCEKQLEKMRAYIVNDIRILYETFEKIKDELDDYDKRFQDLLTRINGMEEDLKKE